MATVLERANAGAEEIVGVAVTDGGAPSAGQRRDLVRILGRIRPRGAVITVNPLARGVVTALSWLGIQIRSFSPTELGDGLLYLGLPGRYHADAIRMIVETAHELSTRTATIELIQQKLQAS